MLSYIVLFPIIAKAEFKTQLTDFPEWPVLRMEDTSTKRFVELLTSAQPGLYALSVALVGDLDVASDILQDANCVIWEKASEYDHERDFMAWACGIVRYQVLTHFRDSGRDRLQFRGELLDQIVTEFHTETLYNKGKLAALKQCYQALTDRQQKLLDMRYAHDGTVAKMAEVLSRPASSISSSLTRIRRTLAECVKRKISSEGSLP